jgi:hypothetical protein
MRPAYTRWAWLRSTRESFRKDLEGIAALFHEFATRLNLSSARVSELAAGSEMAFDKWVFPFNNAIK